MATIATTAKGNTIKSRGRKSQKQIIASRNREIFLSIVFVFVIFLALVSISAIGATIQTQNNSLREQNEMLQAEIDSLNDDINEATSIERIERIATEELGMVQPDESNYIVITDEGDKSYNLAATIKEEAYN